MSHPIQSQLFPENFLYVVAPKQTHTLKKELEVYLQRTRGFRIFSEVGFWDPIIEKFFFCLKMTGNGQKQYKYFFKCISAFFEVFGTFSYLIYHDEQFDQR